MRGLQRMAVRAQDPEVLDPVVIAIAVRVVELEWKASIGCTLRPPTELAPRMVRRPEREPDVPSPAGHVRRVEAEVRNPTTDMLEVAARGNQAERANHAGETPLRSDRAA